MKCWEHCLLFCLILFGSRWGLCDSTSGPHRSTIKPLPWGSLYFEPSQLGACQLEPNLDGFKFTSNQGEVLIKGIDVNGFRITWGKEVININLINGDLVISGQDKTWTLRSVNERVTLTSTSPKETVVFNRSANTFTITGVKGTVTLTADLAIGGFRIQSPLGITTSTNQYGKRTFTGPALDQIPYLGRGLFIPFHGIGIFVDITARFPMPEVSEWLEWKAILEP